MRSVRQSNVKLLVFCPEVVSSWMVSVVDIDCGVVYQFPDDSATVNHTKNRVLGLACAHHSPYSFASLAVSAASKPNRTTVRRSTIVTHCKVLRPVS